MYTWTDYIQGQAKSKIKYGYEGTHIHIFF